MDIATTISRNVKKLRTSRGLTQKAFADKIGVSYHTVISIERGKATSIEVMERISDVFEMAPAELIAESPERKPLLNTVVEELAVENGFRELPPFKQSFYKAVAVELDKIYDRPLNEAYVNFKACLLEDIEKGIDLIDPESMTAVEVKSAAVKAVRDAVSAH